MIDNENNKVKIIKVTNNFTDKLAPLMDEYRVFYGRQSNFDEAKHYVSMLVENDNVVFLMAVSTGEKEIGFCTLLKSYSSVRAAEIYILNDLYVCKDHRRRGYSTQLLDAAVSLARSEGVKFLKLETAKDNVVAQSVYERNGWKQSGFLSYIIELL